MVTIVQLQPPVLLVPLGSHGQAASNVPRPLVLWAASRKGRERERRERERCGSGGGGGGGGGVDQYEQREGATAADCRTTCPRGRLLCVSGWGRGHNCGLEKTRTRNRRQQDPMPMSYILAC